MSKHTQDKQDQALDLNTEQQNKEWAMQNDKLRIILHTTAA